MSRAREHGAPQSSRGSLLVQAGTVACLLVLLANWAFSDSQQQTLQQGAGAAAAEASYVSRLPLRLDAGAVEQQAEADEWCAREPQFTAWPPRSDAELRRLRVAVVMDRQCSWQESVGDARVERCLDAITARCKHLAPNGCFGSNSLTLPECRDVRPLEELPDGTPVRFNNYQLWWQTILAKIAPHLRGQGWSNFKILSDKSSLSERRMARCADVLVTSTQIMWQLYPYKFNQRPQQRVVLIEQDGATTFLLPPGGYLEAAVETNRTISVVKHVVSRPSRLQNGPFLEQRAHLALMAPQIPGSDKYITMKEGAPWSQATLDKIVALLPMTVRFSNSIQCGGSWSFVRYRGFFTKDHKRWPIPALQDRQYDVTFIGKLQYEAKDAVSGVTAHRMAAVKALTAFREKWGEQYKVYVPQGERLEYQQYIALLKNSKLVLSPWGWGEWSHKDFEILMAGCVVIKPRSDIFDIYPPIFEHNQTAIGVREDFSDLEQQILPFLRDTPRAQAMATRQQGVFRHHSQAEVMAADWDRHLLQVIGRSYEQQAAAAGGQQGQQQRQRQQQGGDAGEEDDAEQQEQQEEVEEPQEEGGDVQQQQQQEPELRGPDATLR